MDELKKHMSNLSHMGKGDWESWLSFYSARMERGWDGKVKLFQIQSKKPLASAIGGTILGSMALVARPRGQAMLLE